MADATQQSAEDFLGPDPNSAEAFLDAPAAPKLATDDNDEAASEVGAGEAGVHYVTGGLIAPIAAGLTYLGTLGNKEAAQAAQEKFTYSPRSEQGKAAVEATNAVVPNAVAATNAAGDQLLSPADLAKVKAANVGIDNASQTAKDVEERAMLALGALPVLGKVAELSGAFRAPHVPETPPKPGVPEPAPTPPSIDEVLGSKTPAQEPQAAPAPAAAEAQPKAALAPSAAPAAPEAAPKASPAAEAPATPSNQELERHQALHDVGFTGPVRESAVTGDQMTAATDAQVAKADTPKGRQAQELFQNETDTLHDYAGKLVDQAGGTEATHDINDSVARGARGEALAAPAQAGYERMNADISALYKAADDRAGGSPGPLRQLSQLLNERSSFNMTQEGAAMLRGIEARLGEMGLRDAAGGILPATAEQAERLRQFVGEGWSPRTGRLVSKIQDAIDDDVTSHAGQDIYGASRALRRQRDLMYDKPDAVSNLLTPKNGEARPNGWALEQLGARLTSLPEERFKPYIDMLASQRNEPTLRAGAERALHEIRGQFAKALQEAGRPSNAGLGKQSVWDADKVSKVLAANRARMQQVFTPAEMKQFDALDKAGKILKIDRTFKGSLVEGHNIATRGALSLLEHGPTMVGATLGHIPGAIVGGAVGQVTKKLARGVEERAAPAVKTRPPLGARVGGGAQRGAVGDLTRARKAGDGIKHAILSDGKEVGNISGFERNNAFHMYRVGLRDDSGAHGTGLFQRAAQEVANKYPEGSFVHEWEASPALKKALAKMPTREQVGDRIYVRPEGAARQTPADRLISNFNAVTKEHPTQVGTRAFNGASVELSHDPFDPNTVHIESMRADKGGQGTSSKVLQGLTAMADRHGARLTLDSVPMKPNPGETAIPADKLASIYKAHGFTPTEGGLVEGSAMERAPAQVATATPRPTFGPAPGQAPLGARIGGGAQRGAVGDLSKKGATPEAVHEVSKTVNPADKPAAEEASTAVDGAQGKAAADIVRSNQLRASRTDAIQQLKKQAQTNVDPKKSMGPSIETGNPGKSPTMQLADAFDKALANHNSLPVKEKIANSKAARASVRQFVKGDLITQNGKLMKSNGENIETWGLALSPDYVEGRFMACPNSGACRDLCLGYTSGQFHAGGGGMDLSAFKGPRKAALDRTFAMLHDPEAFAVRLNDEITAAKHKAAANGNQLGIRLNVLSDLNPRIHQELIKSHPDVQFYDYTKMSYKPVAENHHYTHSSTGVSQPAGVNGNDTNVFNPHQNWTGKSGARAKLDGGDNVAMAFTHNRHLPTEVHDEETGKTYKVVNGDEHDFRPLDKQPAGQPGVIIGLKNKKVAGAKQEAHIDANGFFVHYDPKELRTPKGTLQRDANGDTTPTNRSVTIATQHGGTKLMTDNDLKQLAEKGLEAPWQRTK